MTGQFFFQSMGAPRFAWKPLILGWLVAEVLAFALAVRVLGLGGTIMLGLLTSFVGVVVLRRLGLQAAGHLRGAWQAGTPRDGAFVDSTLSAFGALLLILPGLVSDLVGLALVTPSVRQRIARRFVPDMPADRPKPRKQAPDVIDLAPEDWKIVDAS